MSATGPVVAAQVVLPCSDLDETLEFFTGVLGFQVETISPADDPVVAVVVGHGVRLRLDSTASGAPGALRLLTSDAALLRSDTLTAPNGTTVQIVDADPALAVPALVSSLAVSTAADDTSWNTGRAGMHYRDLDPSRQGGRFIASHIRIPDGGPVPDYVHYHRIGFQLIYCVRGWVKVVYEDQGEPFVMRAGDCVLQPPMIRHRVLESSPAMEVVEVGSPAVHDTFGDLELSLPTARLLPDRDFGGQRFVRHVASAARWEPWRAPGFEVRDTGIATASRGVASAQVVRSRGATSTPAVAHSCELLLMFVLEGAATFVCDHTGELPLVAGDSVVVPPATTFSLQRCSDGFQFLEVTAPARGAVAAR